MDERFAFTRLLENKIRVLLDSLSWIRLVELVTQELAGKMQNVRGERDNCYESRVHARVNSFPRTRERVIRSAGHWLSRAGSLVRAVSPAEGSRRYMHRHTRRGRFYLRLCFFIIFHRVGTGHAKDRSSICAREAHVSAAV